MKLHGPDRPAAWPGAVLVLAIEELNRIIRNVKPVSICVA
jgi:hypothetical protein